MIGAAVVFLISNIDGLIKTAVEEFGSRITKTQVTLREVEISTSGEGALRGFKMGNPAGFKTASAVELGEISIKLDTASVTSDVVLIREIVIAAPQITYELGSSGSNIDAIRKNVAAFTGGGGGGDDDGGTRMIVENLYIRGGKISVSAKGAVGALGIGKVMDKVGAGAKGAREAVEKDLKGAGDTLEKGVEGVGGAITGLFGK